VHELRNSFAIPAYAISRRATLDRLLGRYTDVELARAFGYTPEGIARRRRQLGIPRANVREAHARHRLQEYFDRMNAA
jgi:hypothetical protein